MKSDENFNLDNIISSRKAKHLTQKDISDKSGLSVKCISDIENVDNGNPTMKSLIKYLDALGFELYFQPKTF